jgi:hypothetical protein
MHQILNHIDCFVSASRGNKSVKVLDLYPKTFYGQDEHVWDKLGQAFGNLQALERICIASHNYYHDDDDDDKVAPIRGWEIIARILSHMR